MIDAATYTDSWPIGDERGDVVFISENFDLFCWFRNWLAQQTDCDLSWSKHEYTKVIGALCVAYMLFADGEPEAVSWCKQKGDAFKRAECVSSPTNPAM